MTDICAYNLKGERERFLILSVTGDMLTPHSAPAPRGFMAMATSTKPSYPWQQQGEIFRERRESLGKNQQQLAEQAGISNTTISKLERGRQDPNRMEPRTLLALASALEWSIDELSRSTGIAVIAGEASSGGFNGNIDSSQDIGVKILMLDTYEITADGSGELVKKERQAAFLPSNDDFTQADADAGRLINLSGEDFPVSLGGITRPARQIVVARTGLNQPGDYVVVVMGRPTIQHLDRVPADIEERVQRGEVIGRVVSVSL